MKQSFLKDFHTKMVLLLVAIGLSACGFAVPTGGTGTGNPDRPPLGDPDQFELRVMYSGNYSLNQQVAVSQASFCLKRVEYFQKSGENLTLLGEYQIPDRVLRSHGYSTMVARQAVGFTTPIDQPVNLIRSHISNQCLIRDDDGNEVNASVVLYGFHSRDIVGIRSEPFVIEAQGDEIVRKDQGKHYNVLFKAEEILTWFESQSEQKPGDRVSIQVVPNIDYQVELEKSKKD